MEVEVRVVVGGVVVVVGVGVVVGAEKSSLAVVVVVVAVVVVVVVVVVMSFYTHCQATQVHIIWVRIGEDRRGYGWDLDGAWRRRG